MPWRVRFEKNAQKDLAQIGAADRQRIARFIRDRLVDSDNPRDVGEPLAGPLKGYWKYRVGNYRIIASIEDAVVTVVVVLIGNRREVYR